MDYHVIVKFDPDDTDNQREFLKAMNGLDILKVSRDDIEEAIKDMKELNCSSENRIVLHGDEQKTLFEAFMKNFFPEKDYTVEC